MTTGTSAVVAPTRARHSKEIRDAYLVDICQALSNYVAAGRSLSFVSSGDKLGRLVIALTIDDEVALIDGLSETLRTGASSHRADSSRDA